MRATLVAGRRCLGFAYGCDNRPRWGYRQVHWLLVREGFRVNHKARSATTAMGGDPRPPTKCCGHPAGTLPPERCRDASPAFVGLREESMKERGSEKAIRKSSLLWVVVALSTLVTVRLLPKTRPDPLDEQATDKAFHIGLADLPGGWRSEWASDGSVTRRLRLIGPDGRMTVDVLAFKGDLDKSRLSNVGALLFGEASPPPRSEAQLMEYGAEVSRSTSSHKHGAASSKSRCAAVGTASPQSSLSKA